MQHFKLGWHWILQDLKILLNILHVFFLLINIRLQRLVLLFIIFKKNPTSFPSKFSENWVLEVALVVGAYFSETQKGQCQSPRAFRWDCFGAWNPAQLACHQGVLQPGFLQGIQSIVPDLSFDPHGHITSSGGLYVTIITITKTNKYPYSTIKIWKTNKAPDKW